MRLLATAAVLSSLFALSACDVSTDVVTPKPAPTFTGAWEDNSAGGQTVSQTGVNTYRTFSINADSAISMDSSKDLAGNEVLFQGGLNHYDYGTLEASKTDSRLGQVVLSNVIKESAKRTRQPAPVITMKLVSDDTLIWTEAGKDVVYKKVDAAAADLHKRSFSDAIIKRDAALASFKNFLSGRSLVLTVRTLTRWQNPNPQTFENRVTPASSLRAMESMADGTVRYNILSLRAGSTDFIMNDSMTVKLVPAFDIPANAFVVSIMNNNVLVARAQVDSSVPNEVHFKGPEMHLPSDGSGKDIVQQTTDTYGYR